MSDEHGDDPDIINRLSTGHSLRVVPQNNDGRSRPTPDPELKAMLDEMKRRHRVTREQLEDEDDAPDAA